MHSLLLSHSFLFTEEQVTWYPLALKPPLLPPMIWDGKKGEMGGVIRASLDMDVSLAFTQRKFFLLEQGMQLARLARIQMLVMTVAGIGLAVLRQWRQIWQ